MVFKELKAVIDPPDPRPSKAHPEHRAKRKQFENENPHFNMREAWLKAGVLATMAAVAAYPWEKKYDEHVAKHHSERLENRKSGEGKGKSDDRRKGRDTDGDRGRRKSADYRGSERRRSVGYGSDIDAGIQRRLTAPNSVAERPRRGSVIGRLPVAEGFEYVPANREYIDRVPRGSVDGDWERRARRRSVDVPPVYRDAYGYRDRRAR